MQSFRVFLSYAHRDRTKATKVAAVLKEMGCVMVWDPEFRQAKPVADEVKQSVECAHVFMPLLTQQSKNRAWPNQELGYAVGLSIPVVPLSIGVGPGQLIGGLLAVHVRGDLSNLEAKLKGVNWEDVVLPADRPPYPSFTCAKSSTARAKVIVENLGKVEARSGDRAFIRYQAALTSLSIPDAPHHNPIWPTYEGPEFVKGKDHREAYRQERRQVELHAKEKGCRLVLNPCIPLRNGPEAMHCRLTILAESLQKMDDQKVEAVLCRDMPPGNLLLVGDWFVAESLSVGPGGIEETLFTWHAPYVLRRLRDFDKDFAKYAGATSKLHGTRAAALLRAVRDGKAQVPPCEPESDEAASPGTSDGPLSRSRNPATATRAKAGRKRKK